MATTGKIAVPGGGNNPKPQAQSEAKSSPARGFDAKKLKKERQNLAAKTEKLIARRDAMDRQVAEAAHSKSGSGTTSAQLDQASSILQDQEQRHMTKLSSSVAHAEALYLAEPTDPLRQNWDALREMHGRFRSHLGPRIPPKISDDETTSSSGSSSSEGDQIKKDVASSKANSSAKRSAKEDSKRKRVDDAEKPSKKHKHDKKGRSDSPVPVSQAKQENSDNTLPKPSSDQEMDKVATQEKPKKDKKKRKKEKKDKHHDGNDADMEDIQHKSHGNDANSIVETSAERKLRKKKERKELKRASSNMASPEANNTEDRLPFSGKSADKSKAKDAPERRPVTAVPLPAHYPRSEEPPVKSSSPIPVPEHYPHIAGTLTPIRLRHGSKIATPVDPASKHRDTGPRGTYLPVFSSADYAAPDGPPKPNTPDPAASPKTWLMEGSGSRRSKGKSDITLRIGRLSPGAHSADPDADESPAEVVRKNKGARGRPKGSKTKNRKASSAAATPVAAAAVSLPSSAVRSDDLVRALTPSTRVAAAFAAAGTGQDLERREALFKAQLERDMKVLARERIEWRNAMNLE